MKKIIDEWKDKYQAKSLFFVRQHWEKIIFFVLLIAFILSLGIVLTPESYKIYSNRIDNEENEKKETKIVAKLGFLGDYWGFGQRDMFRPYKSAASKQIQQIKAKTSQGPEDYLLFTGSFKTNIEQVAMIKDIRDGKSYFKSKGERACGFRILHIKKKCLILSNDSGDIITLIKGGKKKTGRY